MPWGPNGHPIALTNNPTGGTPSSTYLHYDGDTLLFTTSATGQLLDVRPELLGVYSTGANIPYRVPASGGFVVQDRDFSELNVSTHGAVSYTGIDYGSGPFKSGKLTTTSVAMDGGYPAGPDFSDGPDPDPILQYTHPDGFSTPLGVIQGVRAMDPDLGTWKSPDAYAGDVRDPMSQKPYMWNGNNPYQYSDPSGYCIGPAVVICPEMIAIGAAAVREAASPGTGGAVGLEIRGGLSAARAASAREFEQLGGWAKGTFPGRSER